MKNWLLGNLDIAAHCQEVFPDGMHPHSWIPYMQKRYGMGDIFYMDWSPLGPRWLFITNPEIIGQHITTTQSLHKSPLEANFLDIFLGPHNMVSVEGATWKNLRTMFNPGFSATHLMTLVPYIVDSSLVFYDVLRQKAETNELIGLEELGTRLTIDIIGKVVLDADFDSQKKPHPIVETFRDRVNYMPKSRPIAEWITEFEFIRKWKLRQNQLKLDKLIGEELDRKIASRAAASAANGSAKEPTSLKDRKRSVIELALDAYQKEFATSPKPGAPMDKAFRDAAIRQHENIHLRRPRHNSLHNGLRLLHPPLPPPMPRQTRPRTRRRLRPRHLPNRHRRPNQSGRLHRQQNGIHHSHHQRNPSPLPSRLHFAVSRTTRPHLPGPQRSQPPTAS